MGRGDFLSRKAEVSLGLAPIKSPSPILGADSGIPGERGLRARAAIAPISFALLGTPSP